MASGTTFGCQKWSGGDHFWLPKLVWGDRFWLPKLVPGPHLGRTIFAVTGLIQDFSVLGSGKIMHMEPHPLGGGGGGGGVCCPRGKFKFPCSGVASGGFWVPKNAEK